MKIIKRTIQILGINLKEIFLFEILYRLTTGVMFLSLFTRGMALAIQYSGYSYLTTKNIGMFLVKPVTVLVMLVILGVGILFLLVETSALLAAFQAGEKCERLTTNRIFVRGIIRCRYYLKVKNFYCIGFNLLLQLVFQYVLLIKSVTHIKLLNDIVEGIGKSTRWSGTIVFLAVVAVFVFLPGLFTVHFGLLNQREGKEALKESFRLVSRHTIHAVLYLFCLNIILYGIFRLVLLALAFLSAVIIYFFVSKTIALALYLTAYNWLEIAALGMASIVNGVCNMALLTGLYYTYRDEAGLAPELLVSEEKQRSRRGKKTRRALIVLFVLIFFAFLYDVVENGIQLAKNVLVETEITAHRGSSMEAPENTLFAVQLAIEQMADYVEIDVQLSKDGEIILLHDKNFKRTCNDGRSPWNMTLEEIKKLNAAAYMPGHERAYVPTLREVLEYCKDKVNLNIELKNNGHDDELPYKVSDLVREYNMENQCVYTSTSLPFLEQMKELDEKSKIGYILSTAYGDFSQNERVDFFSISSSLLNEKNITQIHETGREIHAWTVNTKTEIERMKYLHVDNIITDYPVLVREILYREEDTENFFEFLMTVLD